MENATNLSIASQTISNRPVAFLYRMKDRDSITDRLRNEYAVQSMEYLGEFPARLQSIIMDNTAEEAIYAIENFFNKEESEPNLPAIYTIAKLKTIQDDLANFIKGKLSATDKLSDEIIDACTSLIDQQVQKLAFEDSDVTKRFNTVAYARACEIYFGEYFKRRQEVPEKFRMLRDTGKLYCLPPEGHSWEANSSWLLERFQNGCEFVIMSIVCNESKLRSSGLIGSGFFREIAACYKQGYRFIQEGNEIVLKHPNFQSLRNLRVEDIRMSDWEVDDMFEKATADFNRICRPTTTPGTITSKFMREEEANQMLKGLISAGVDKLCTRVIHTIGTDDSYYIEVRSANIADLRVAANRLGLLLDKTSKVKIEVEGFHFRPIEIDTQEFQHMGISKDVYGGVMLTKFHIERREKKEKEPTQVNNSQDKPKPPY